MFIDECAICQFVGPVNYCATRLIGTSWLVMNGNVGFCNFITGVNPTRTIFDRLCVKN